MLSDRHMAPVTRDKELWAIALIVEQKKGSDGPLYIAEMIGEAALEGDQVGIDLWNAVAVRFSKLSTRHVGKNEGAISYSGKKTQQVQPTRRLKWLPELDSNQRPSD